MAVGQNLMAKGLFRTEAEGCGKMPQVRKEGLRQDAAVTTQPRIGGIPATAIPFSGITRIGGIPATAILFSNPKLAKGLFSP